MRPGLVSKSFGGDSGEVVEQTKLRNVQRYVWVLFATRCCIWLMRT